jgi:hypothetical protein
MSASDSPTNLAWQINQNSPTSRVTSMEQNDKGGSQRVPAADFAGMTINPELLER